MLEKKYLMSAAAGAVAMASLGLGAFAFADTTAINTTQSQPQMHQRGVGGTVTAVSGNTITVTGMDGKTYTIDATGASITKDMTVGVSDINVGDTVGAQGSVSGTSITATNIHDGKMPMMGKGMWHHGPRPNDNDADDASTQGTSAPTTQTTQ